MCSRFFSSFWFVPSVSNRERTPKRTHQLNRKFKRLFAYERRRKGIEPVYGQRTTEYHLHILPTTTLIVLLFPQRLDPRLVGANRRQLCTKHDQSKDGKKDGFKEKEDQHDGCGGSGEVRAVSEVLVDAVHKLTNGPNKSVN